MSRFADFKWLPGMLGYLRHIELGDIIAAVLFCAITLAAGLFGLAMTAPLPV